MSTLYVGNMVVSDEWDAELGQKLLQVPWLPMKPLWCSETTTLYKLFLPSSAVNNVSDQGRHARQCSSSVRAKRLHSA